jgi:hypothetical protein
VVDDADVTTLAARLFDPDIHRECNGADANGDGATSAADLPATIALLAP